MVQPLSTPQLPAQVSAAATAASSSSPRIGRVISYDTMNVTVAISGAPVLQNAARLRGYQPVLGDFVLVQQFGTQWVVLDALSGSPSTNVLRNPSFEDGATHAAIPSWSQYHDPTSTMASSFSTMSCPGAITIDGDQAANLSITVSGSGTLSAIDYLVSSPFAVQPGELWGVSAWVQAWYAVTNVPPAINVGVWMSWYANDTNTYPNTSAADSVISNTFISAAPAWYLIGASNDKATGILVPQNASFARVMLGSTIFIPSTAASMSPIYWDLVVASKLRNADGSLA